MIFYYRNSFLASVVSILGCIFALCGIMMFPEGQILGGIICLILAVPLFILAKRISQNKAFKKWWQQVIDNNLEIQIAGSVQTAIAIYNKNPQKRTLEKIAALNPAAAAQIRQQLDAKKKK